MSFRIYILALTLILTSLCPAATSTAGQPGRAQQYFVHAWHTDDGLPQNWVSGIAQTPEGYLWVATRYGGLGRFDGVRFVAFNPQNTPELKDVQVEHISVDDLGRLWIVMGNESITSVKEGKFELWRWPRSAPKIRASRVLRGDTNQIIFAGELPYLARLHTDLGTNGWQAITPPSLLSANPSTFCRGADGSVWFITANGQLARFHDNRFQEATELAEVTLETVISITTDPQRRLWAATANQLFVWNGRTLEERTPQAGPPLTQILRIAFSGDGGLWVLERNSIRKFEGDECVTVIDPDSLNPAQLHPSFSLYGDSAGDVWIVGYGQGLWHVKADGAVHSFRVQDGLPSLFITCWMQDSEGNVWVGTAGGGIARIRQSPFRVFGTESGLPARVVRSVCIDEDGQLWAGLMAGGVARWKNDRFERVPLPASTFAPVESVTVAPARGGGLWVGSLNQGLLRLEGETFTRIVDGSIRVLYPDRKGGLWFGELTELYHYAEKIISFLGSAEGYIQGHALGAVAQDSSGIVWLGTGPGQLWRFETNKFQRFDPPSQWPSVRFAALLPDTDGGVWIGTLGGGLLRFKDGEFFRFMASDGLPDNYISQLLDAGDGTIWGGTYAGIFRVRKEELDAFASGKAPEVRCRAFGRFDGLPALECPGGFQPACWRGEDGRLWFTTANGIVMVDPAEVTENRRPPLVLIEEMLVDGKQHSLPGGITYRRWSQESDLKSIRIGPGRHYVEFRFTGLNYSAPDRVQFRVGLEGKSGERWQDTGTQRQIGFGPLLPGTYKLRVQARNNDGIWNEQGAALSFQVLPHFWETRWFRTAMAGILLGGLTLGVAVAQRRRYRLRLMQLERERAIERERSRIAQDLHDDLGTSLTQISMLSSLATRDQTPAHEVNSLLQQMRGRSREMVTALDEIVWAVNPKNDSMLEVVNYLAFFAEEFFRHSSIRCRLDIPVHLPKRLLSAEVRHHLFLAFKEALNNVARHSGASEVLVRIAPTPEALLIEVRDNGTGFEANGKKIPGGNGLLNMKDRMAKIGGTALIDVQPEGGVAVIFRLPLGRPAAFEK